MLRTSYAWPEIEPFDSTAMTPDVFFEAQDGEKESWKLHLQSPDNTVDSGLQFTRVVFSFIRSGKGAIRLPGIDQPFDVGFTPVSESEEKKLLYQAKLYRKLKYIERVFNVKFSLPEMISSEEVKRVEIVFRGITEGHFSIREPEVTFRTSPDDINLSKPPYFGLGQFDAMIGEEIELFDDRLKVGPVTVHIDKAELANPGVADQIQKGSKEPVVVRFEILDNQMSFRFEDYIKQSKKHLVESLKKFKQELALEDPKELVDLVSEPLSKDVSSFEASQIAMGWTQYHDLPDRYCPQDPELDNDAGHWRVPIYLVYTGGEGGPIGEVIIDVKTGVIISHTAIEELRSKGLALAKQILHA